MGFFKGTRVRNSRGKRAISVRATEGLLYLDSEKLFGPENFKVENVMKVSNNYQTVIPKLCAYLESI